MKQLWVLLVILLSIISVNAFAGCSAGGTIVGIGISETQTKGYAGLAWALGAKKSSAVPDLVAGVRSVKVKSNDSVSSGADVSARFSFLNGFSFDSLRLSYVGGVRDIFGNIGVGYSFANQSFLSTIAAQGAYSRAGLDYEFNANKVLPYFELLSIDKPKKVNDRLICSDGSSPILPGAQLGSYCGPGG